MPISADPPAAAGGADFEPGSYRSNIVGLCPEGLGYRPFKAEDFGIEADYTYEDGENPFAFFTPTGSAVDVLEADSWQLLFLEGIWAVNHYVSYQELGGADVPADSCRGGYWGIGAMYPVPTPSAFSWAFVSFVVDASAGSVSTYWYAERDGYVAFRIYDYLNIVRIG